MLGGAGVEVAVAPHAAISEEILVFEVGAVAPAEGLEGDDVAAGLDVGRQVELGFELAILAVSDVFAIDPQIDIGRDRTKMGHYGASLPRLGNQDGAAVGAHMIVAHRHLRRVAVELVAPGVADVDVLRVAVAVELPEAGHGHGGPGGVVEVGGLEAGGAHVGRWNPVEFPQSIEAQKVIRFGHSALDGLMIFEREI